ncbi:MAG: serine hydrolase [Bacteroidales bacterium]|jgi:CubicO group peptidase (beta-lactamase class C family)|nr:serine hydrolase [Bacteroidales bacterium]
MSKTRKILLAIIVLAVFIYIALPYYAKQALVHQMPGIEDAKIFNNRIVRAGDFIPWELNEKYNSAKIADSTYEKMMFYEPVAYLIIQDQKIVYEEYWDGYNEDSLSNSFSMAKGIVSLLIGAALDDGYIESLDQEVGEFIEAYNGGGKEEITIRDVLTMSSGLDWDEAYASLFSPTTESYYGNDLEQLVKGLEMMEKPGVRYYYRSIDTELLAMIVESATGRNISDYCSQKFWKFMGAKHDALWSLDKKEGMEKAFCCFHSNARDFARWGQLILNNGTWNGRQLISETYIKEAIMPAYYLVDDEGRHVDYYGYQWWLIDYNGYKMPYMRGILGQYVFVIPEKNAVVVRLGHKRSDVLIGPNRKDIYVYLEAAFQILE